MKEKIKEAAEIIKAGGLVVYPTETVYGLGANALSSKSVMKVFEAKGREYKKPISIAVKNLSEAKKIAKFNPYALKLAKKFLPGPLTLILPLKAEFPEELTLGKNTIGVRIPNHPVAQKLLKQVNIPITATSANVSGSKESITASDAIKEIGDKVNLVLDAGPCKYGKPSTVVDAVDKVKIVREGVFSKREILSVLS